MEMKRALLTGCGSKFGFTLLKQILSKFDEVDLISSTPIQEIYPKLPVELQNKLYCHYIDWSEDMPYFKDYEIPNKEYELVFFNHNNKPQGFEIDSYYKDVLWTQDIINKIKLHDDIKIGWMITAGIISPPDWFEYSPYFHQKHSRLYLMYFMQWMHPGNYFAIDPGEPSQWTDSENLQQANYMADFMADKVKPATLYKAIKHSGEVQPPEFHWKLVWKHS